MIDHAAKTINSWWYNVPTPVNFGDALPPLLIEWVSGYKAKFTPHPFQKRTLLTVGSILDFASSHTVIWGSGAIRKTTKINRMAKFLAVRGPLTAKLIESAGLTPPEAFGDPALLLPRFYSPIIGKKYKIGIFPHYVDYAMVNEWYHGTPDVKIIDALLPNPLDTVNDILECEHIISSSLHGIIVAHAYGIPATWVKFSDKLAGDDMKFHDYFHSVQLNNVDFINVRDRVPLSSLPTAGFTNNISFDVDQLIGAFPKCTQQ